ncbi:MAG: DMT family transporter, partial [Anaerolineaceae bacterium]|nr:DMT family transporter [Anaerolineaceae bacterium]
MKTNTAIFYAILAAVLYALMAPVSKLLQVSVPPVAEAGLLYLGAGTGMLFIYLLRKKMPADHPSVDKKDLKYVISMIILDMLAPIFLLLGLSLTTPENVSLLNNFEIVATTCIACVFFHEKIGKRLALSISSITESCILLSLDSMASL